MSDARFLSDGRQWLWSPHSIGLAKECAAKYDYVVRQGWISKEESIHVIWGGAYAKALEIWNKASRSEDGLREAVRHCFTVVLPEHDKKTRGSLVRTVIWYTERYKDDPAETYILADGTPAIELAGQFALDDDIIIRIKIDRLITFAHSVYIQDQKSTQGSIGPWYFDQFSPDNQMSGYSAGGRIIYKVPVSGVMIDAVQVAVGFSRFERGFIYRTPAQNEEWLEDARHYIHEMWRHTASGRWPMNDTSCSKFQRLDGELMGTGCPFRKVCSKDPSVRQKYLETNFVRKQDEANSQAS